MLLTNYIAWNWRMRRVGAVGITFIGSCWIDERYLMYTIKEMTDEAVTEMGGRENPAAASDQ